MAGGIPVRLSADLAQRARSAAETSDRSVTEQVEHWARLGQAVEDVALANTVQRLKSRSHDPNLRARIAVADSAEGRARALELIHSRNAVLHGTDAKGAVRPAARPAVPMPARDGVAAMKARNGAAMTARDGAAMKARNGAAITSRNGATMKSPDGAAMKARASTSSKKSRAR